jgi:hypothetical protein
MNAGTARYFRFVCAAVLIALLGAVAFLAGYRIGYFDGYALYEMTFNGKRVQLVPIDSNQLRR